MLILAVILTPDVDRAVLVMTHPQSAVKQVHISCNYDQEVLGLLSHPAAYTYALQQVGPYSQRLPESRFDLPQFLLSGADNCPMFTQQDWEQRATLLGFGTALGNALFAALLLDVGRPGSDVYEYEIGHAMNNSIAPLSAEARLWLPGHGSWDTDLFPLG